MHAAHAAHAASPGSSSPGRSCLHSSSARVGEHSLRQLRMNRMLRTLDESLWSRRCPAGDAWLAPSSCQAGQGCTCHPQVQCGTCKCHPPSRLSHASTGVSVNAAQPSTRAQALLRNCGAVRQGEWVGAGRGPLLLSLAAAAPASAQIAVPMHSLAPGSRKARVLGLTSRPGRRQQAPQGQAECRQTSGQRLRCLRA